MKIDPGHRFVRVRLPATTYRVTKLWLYLDETNDLRREMPGVEPFFLTVPAGGQVIFPWSLQTRLLGTPVSYRPSMDVRELNSREISQLETELSLAVTGGDVDTAPPPLSVAESTPALGRLVATVLSEPATADYHGGGPNVGPVAAGNPVSAVRGGCRDRVAEPLRG